MRRILRRLRQRGFLVFLPAATLAWFSPAVSASQEYYVASESDWYFTVSQDQTLVIIYGNSNRECNEPGADPYLWLYDDNPESTGQLIASDDDGNHGQGQCVSSKIYTTLNAGDYRLRAGYFPQQQGIGYTGGEYTLVSDVTFTNAEPITTTIPVWTTTTTTTLPPTTTTSTSTTTTTTTTTSTTSTTTTTTTSSTTTTVPPTTTTSTTSTTTIPTTIPPTTTTTTSLPTTTTSTSTTSTTVPSVTTSTTSTSTTSTTSTTVAPTTTSSTTTSTTTSLPATTTVPTTPTTTSTTTPPPPPTTANTTSTTFTTTTTTEPVIIVEETTTTTTESPTYDETPPETTSVPQPAKQLETTTTTAVLQSIESEEQLLAVIDNIDTLDPEQIDQVVSALNDSSDDIKQQFEEEVNVFGEGFEEYVPSGSTIPVRTRRVVIAAAAAAFAMPAPTSRRT